MPLNYPVELKESDWKKKKGKTVPGAELTKALHKLEVCYGELKTAATEKKFVALSAEASGVAAVANRTREKCVDAIHGATKRHCLVIVEKAREFKKDVDAALEAHEAFIEKQLEVIEAINRNLSKLVTETKATLTKAKELGVSAKKARANPVKTKAAAGNYVKLFDGSIATAKKEFGKFSSISTGHNSIGANYDKLAKSAERLFNEVMSLADEGKQAVKAFQ